MTLISRQYVCLHMPYGIYTTMNLYLEQLTVTLFLYHNIVILCLSALRVFEFYYFNHSNKCHEVGLPGLACWACIPLF
jgi:hypothetical protein